MTAISLNVYVISVEIRICESQTFDISTLSTCGFKALIYVVLLNPKRMRDEESPFTASVS